MPWKTSSGARRERTMWESGQERKHARDDRPTLRYREGASQVFREESAPKYIGATGIFNIDETFKSCEAGVSISPDSFRGGFATDALHTVLTYAFEERRLHRVVFQTATNNIRMRGWLERYGATLEGILRDGWSDGAGGYTNACLYSILEQEWTQTVKTKMEERINRTTS
ncbi:acyl-CoA N-acyltransferase [Mycena leptocephala]|nr:acyl-CoA N-acyltransferase [Mycena leptocephala]